MRTLFFTIVLTAFLTFSAQAASVPVSFNFTQGGFEEGAMVTGMFSGEDLNMDGQLSSFDGEVTSFMLNFSGNNLVPAFSDFPPFPFIPNLAYDLDDGPVLGDGMLGGGDNEGIGVRVPSILSYEAGAGPLGTCPVGICGQLEILGSGVTTTTELVTVTPKPIPTPSAFLLMGTGLLGLIAYRKWNSKTN